MIIPGIHLDFYMIIPGKDFTFLYDYSKKRFQILYNYSRKKNKTKGDPMEPESKALMIEPPLYSIDPVEMRRQHYQTPGRLCVACFSFSFMNYSPLMALFKAVLFVLIFFFIMT